MTKPDLASMRLDELTELVCRMGQPKYKAKQIYIWLRKGASCFDDMTNIAKPLRQQLAEEGYIASVRVAQRWDSRLDETKKYLFVLHDGAYIEGVLMKYHHGYSMCISSQVGCRMGCRFCASTLGGLERNLTAGEMLGQLLAVQKDQNIRISNVVMMGMGEPLDNFEQVERFLELIGDENGLSIGQRHISLSTCGRVDGIERLMELSPQLTLSVSLHAPFDDMRSDMMPINRKYNIARLMQVCRAYTEKTHRRISFEYSLIEGVNDTDICADALAQLLKGMLCHVNLIPINEVKEREYKRSVRVGQFQQRLQSHGINATVRRTLGADIAASCGQLRQRQHEK